MSPRIPFLLALVALPSAWLAAQGSVLVVDAGGGVGSQYTEIQPAIDAAQDGDVVLVRPGSYGGFTLDAKSLVVEGDVGTALPGIYGPASVRNVSGSVVLRNLEFHRTTYFTDVENLAIQDCAGSVLIDGCLLHQGNPALRVGDSAAVTVAASQIEGYDASVSDWWPLQDLHAILGLDSAVYVYDSQLAGGDGRDGSMDHYPWPGGDGIHVHGGVLYSEACIVAGGAGGDGGWFWHGPCIAAADGGSAIRLAASVAGADTSANLPVAYTSANALSGGPGGAALGLCMAGSSGETLEVEAGQHVPLFYWPRFLWMSSPVREGGTITMEFSCQPGEVVFLLVSVEAAPALALELLGSLLPSTSGALLAIGPIPPSSGWKVFAATAGELGPGVEAVGLYLQPLFLEIVPVPMAAVGPPRHLLLLDQSL